MNNKRTITSIFPLLKLLKSYGKEEASGDITAGLTIALLLIPQGMAYAMIAGLPPVYGLYASIIPGIIYSLLGTARQLSVGPVAVTSLLVAVTLKSHELSPKDYIEYAILLAILAGSVRFFLGLFKTGYFLDNFLSGPVISGYTSAAAIIIAVSQIKHIGGLKIDDSNFIFSTIYNFIANLGHIEIYTLIIGIVSMIIIFSLKKINPKIPGSLIVIIIGILTVYLTGLSEKVSVIGDIPRGLPSFHIPLADIKQIPLFLNGAFTLAMVGFMESTSISKAIAMKTRERIDVNQELISLGLANMAGALFQSYPVTGGLSRSAVNYESGAKTGIASIITSVAIAITVLFFTPYLYYIPKTSLAAVIIMAVISLIDIKGAIKIFKIKKKDGYILLITFLSTLFIGVQQGIVIGVFSSLILFIWRTVRPHVAVLGKMPDGEIYRNIERYNVTTWPDRVIFRMDSSLYFANGRFLENKIMDILADNKKIKYLILDSSGINDIDSSGEEILREMVTGMRKDKCDFYMVSVKGPVRDILEKSGFYDFLGRNNFFETISQAVESINSNKSEEKK